MIVYATHITPRLLYIWNFISHELTGKDVHITTDKNEFATHTGLCINYSQQRIQQNECWIKPHGLLFETNIQQQEIQCFQWNELKVFFKTEGDIAFDIAAASFYLLSRYEEYLPHQKDMYGRFAYENALAYKEQFLHRPIINEWLLSFSQILQLKDSRFQPAKKMFEWLPTYDIDEAYSFKYKSLLRTFGAIVKDLFTGNFKQISLRLKVLNQKQNDPFDVYEWMDHLHQQYQLHPKYFFLVANQNGRYDKNILPNQPAFQNLIKQHSEKYSIGIHPSWQSGDNVLLLKKELESLKKIANQEIYDSRQHFIRFSLPHTFRQLIENGITDDYSMGYGSINGFRASVASSFFWYDLENESITTLRLHPFCFMEANSFYEQKQSTHDALKEMMAYYQIVKKIEGRFITIWHNTFLGTDKKFEGWRDVYENFVKEIKS